MKFKIFIAKKAQEDLVSIYDYLVLLSNQTAQEFKESFKKQIDILADGFIDYPLSRFSELAILNYHSVFFKNYVLLYYEEENKRIIAHVFHQSQNYASLV